MGAELLAVAKTMNIEFRLSADMPGEQGGAYCASKKYVALNKNLDDRVLISTLAHELRHVWQHAHMPYKFHLNDQPDETELMAAIIFNRYLEADAFAFSHTFIEDFEQRNGPEGIMTEYRLRKSQYGLDLRSLSGAAYHDKIDFHAAAFGANHLNSYDYEVISNFSDFAGRRVKDADAVAAIANKTPPDMSSAPFAVQQLRDFDRPFMHVPAPFAHLATVHDFCDPKRLTLTENVKQEIGDLQKIFARIFTGGKPVQDAPKVKGMVA